ncbi:eukaryotic translation initiation factor 3 subunit G-like [Copidosoma floridanum]|uniref:eukaryotic translation initiation factor 3 subunit G-like n=1 Tax=Copidosoma floridanum TaxID=29053 RepID=UPI0006C97924|nr:eukaryotic translation initiation factor 3 subunit G-like [Copidosoma floridanum]
MTSNRGISSWADEIEEEGNIGCPPLTVVYENDLKIVTEYKVNEEGERVKVIRTYRIENHTVSKTIAARKTWAKFGDSENDGPGPNPATTLISEATFMRFLSSKEENNMYEEDVLEKLRSMGDTGVIRCRHCTQAHWTSKCPYRDTISMDNDKKPMVLNEETGKSQVLKYVPPNMRNIGNNSDDLKQQEVPSTRIKIWNLPENTTDGDLLDLVEPFGPILKTYLSKYNNTNICKGYAFVHYRTNEEAAHAIKGLHKHRYDHLILEVDWALPFSH